MTTEISTLTPPASLGMGRVLQVNVSPGGVPKLPVERAWVDRLGLAGDQHNDDTEHGGPHRAVALFGIEAIRRVAAEGHPIEPGTVGENLTTEGIEWSSLPVGTRARIGDDLIVEVSKPDMPCLTIRGSFSDERFARISILVNPTDSRMYARVVREGGVRPGDPIILETPAANDATAAIHLLIERADAANRKSQLAGWRAARVAGLILAIVDDGELAMVASREVPGRSRNRALGLTGLPNLLPRAAAFFADAGVEGWAELDEDGALLARLDTSRLQAADRLALFAGEPSSVLVGRAVAGVPGVAIREVFADEVKRWVEAAIGADSHGPVRDGWLRRTAPHLLGTPEQAHRRLFAAEANGEFIGVGAIYSYGKVGWLSAGAVRPDFWNRGIQLALISARAAAAGEAGCTLIASDALVGEPSERNLGRAGLSRLATRLVLPVPRPTELAGG
jgi:MOSC domain-containing protein YiiM